MSHMDDVRARWADPAMVAGAEERVRIMSERLKAKGINKMADALQSAHSSKSKKVWLMKLADTLAESLEGLTPCKKGCNHCCHMATLVTPEEAEAMAKLSGRKWRMPPPEAFKNPDEDGIRKWEGVPCPMLTDEGCSVYAARPWSCRIHYSIDSDSLLCRIVPGESIRAPSPDMTKYHILYYIAHGGPDAVRHADIREYFP